jgi:hypothetical protein
MKLTTFDASFSSFSGFAGGNRFIVSCDRSLGAENVLTRDLDPDIIGNFQRYHSIG